MDTESASFYEIKNNTHLYFEMLYEWFILCMIIKKCIFEIMWLCQLKQMIRKIVIKKSHYCFYMSDIFITFQAKQFDFDVSITWHILSSCQN